MLATRYSMLTTAGGLATEGDLDGFGVEAAREDRADFFEEAGWQLDVVRLAGALVVKMRVRAEVRAVPGGAALEVHGADEVARDERFETVVNRGERDGGALGLHAREDFVGRGVVALLEQHVVNDLALRRGAQAAVGEALGKGIGGEGGGGHRVEGVGQSIGMVLR